MPEQQQIHEGCPDSETERQQTVLCEACEGEWEPAKWFGFAGRLKRIQFHAAILPMSENAPLDLASPRMWDDSLADAPGFLGQQTLQHFRRRGDRDRVDFVKAVELEILGLAAGCGEGVAEGEALRDMQDRIAAAVRLNDLGVC
jgi:hypothetical protein